MGNGIYSIGQSALAAAQTGLLTAGHNIANVDTAGYSRQEAVFAARPPQFTGSGYIGQGVSVATVRRVYSDFLGAQEARAQADASQLETYGAQLARLDDLFGDASSGLSPALDEFFSSVNGVAQHPDDTSSRTALIASAQSLVARFHDLAGQLDEMRAGADAAVEGSVGTIDGYLSGIANLNRRIAEASAATAHAPNDLLDQRDELVRALNEQIGATVVPQSDGSYNVFLSNGQAVVVGQQATPLAVARDPQNPQRLALGVTIGSAFVPFAAGSVTGGALGGLLDFRDGALEGAQDALGRLALTLARTFNDQHRLGLDLSGTPGGDFFTPPAPQVTNALGNAGTAQVAVAIADATAVTGSDYRLAYDGTDFTLTRLSDGATTTYATLPQTVDGLVVALGSGAPAAGDRFLIQPTHFAAGRVALALTDPARIAAAAPVRTAARTDNAGSGVIGAAGADASYLASPLTTAVTLTYDRSSNTLTGFPATSVSVAAGGTTTTYPPGAPVAYVDGATITFGGLSFILSGTPADGDAFAVEPNVGARADNRNASALAALADARLVAGRTTTYAGAYGELVAAVGTETNAANLERDAQATLLSHAQQAKASVSGVNLDEEAADLQRFQQAYQAASKVIAIGNAMFDAILEIARN